MAANEAHDNAWGYTPNRVAPVIFAALFTASGSWHIWQARHYKSWKMTLLLPVGSLFYIAGLLTREAGSYVSSNASLWPTFADAQGGHSFFAGNDGLYIASRVLTLDATAVAAAANYFVLGRTLYYIPWASPVDPRRVTQIFIFLDWLTGIFAAAGLSHVYNDSASDVRLGAALVRTSLLLQIVLYACYLLVLALWHRRVLQANVQRPLAPRYLRALYGCGVLILIRCIYRTVEYFQGAEGHLDVREAYYYLLDASVILSMMLLLNVFHPGRYFPEDSSVYLATDGATEVSGPGWSDERRWYWTTADPLGLADYFKSSKSKGKFWERDESRQSAELCGPDQHVIA